MPKHSGKKDGRLGSPKKKEFVSSIMNRNTSVRMPATQPERVTNVSSHAPYIGDVAGLTCPPGQNILITSEGSSFCGNNKETVTIRNLKKAMNELSTRLEREAKYTNITDFVSPYFLTPAERKTLEILFGPKSSQIAMNAALRRSGIVNSECPPDMEKYIDVMKGQIQCRPKFRRLIKTADKDKCKYGYAGDPLAIEPYTDAYGNTKCRKPVMRGYFECPPPDHPVHTEMVVLPDGTGMCVEPKTNLDSKAFIFEQLIYPSNLAFEVEKIRESFENANVSPEGIREMNQVLKSMKDIRAYPLPHMQPVLMQIYSDMRNRYNSEPDTRLINHGLLQYAMRHSPSYFENGGVPTEKAVWDFLTPR
jgi:hypothetical protein